MHRVRRAALRRRHGSRQARRVRPLGTYRRVYQKCRCAESLPTVVCELAAAGFMLSDCATAAGFMLSDCATSCAEENGNDAAECAQLIKAGGCYQNREVATSKCRSGCFRALSGNLTEDKEGNCWYWSTDGECEANPSWMATSCGRSCKKARPQRTAMPARALP